MADDPIIRVESLTAAYEGKAIIEDVSFEVHRGEVFVIILGASRGLRAR